LDMNIAVCERPLPVPVSILNDDPYTTQRGLESILQSWTDRPSRSWIAVERGPGCSPQYVVVQTVTDHGRIEMGTIEETDKDLYSLSAIDHALGGEALTWGAALGEPALDVQHRVLSAMRERGAKGARLPETWPELEQFVLLAVGDAGL